MEDDPQGAPLAGSNYAHTVTHRSPIPAAGPAHRPAIDREQDRIALSKRDRRPARLHARSLLSQQEFAALEILARPRKQDRRLDREDVRSVQILVKRIPA